MQLLQAIKELISAATPDQMRTRIVAIDGCGGAGKTTFATRLAGTLDNCPIMHTDDFASWDHPIDWYPQLIEQVLEPLRQNHVAHYQKFNWQANQPGQWETLEPCYVMILEDVSASRPEFRSYLSFSVYIETDRELRLKRRIERDGEEILPLWQQWMTEEDECVLRDQPQKYADLVLFRNTEDMLRISSSF